MKKPSNKKTTAETSSDYFNETIDIPSFVNASSENQKDGALDTSFMATSSDSKKNLIAQMLEDTSMTDLSSAKANWYFGEWNALVELDIQALSSHPDVSMFAALKAAGFQQLGDLEQSKTYFSLAKKLGCENKFISQLLISGVHNGLGKIAALKKDDDKMLSHFNASVCVGGTKNNNKLARQARSVKEVSRLGLLPQSVQMLNDISISYTDRPAQTQQQIDFLNKALFDIKTTVAHSMPSATKSIPLDFNSDSSITIVIAGMRHSGSTALFNILRLALKKSGIEVLSGYSERLDIESVTKKTAQVCLIKTHELRDDVLQQATVIITTRRDLRNTVASAVRRKFAMVERIGGVIEYAKYNRSLFEQWDNFSQYQFNYENFMEAPIAAIKQLLVALGVSNVNAEAIYKEIMTLPTDQYNTTLLSPTHITDPKRMQNYKTTLTSEQIEAIEQQHSYWLKKYKYN